MPSDLRMQETGTHTISTFFSTLRRRVLTLTPVQRLAALFSDLSGEAVSPLLTLSMLKDRPMYGYELSTLVSGKSGGLLKVSVLYTVLFRLQAQGYIETISNVIVDGRARTYYAITDAGRAYLEKTLAEYRTLNQLFLELTEETAS